MKSCKAFHKPIEMEALANYLAKVYVRSLKKGIFAQIFENSL